VRQLEHRETVPGGASNQSGPVLVAFRDDVVVERTTALPTPTPTLHTTTPRRAALNATSACRPANLGNCDAQLEMCFLTDPGDVGVVCGCFGAWARCYRVLGCVERLPAEQVSYCLHRGLCGRGLCEGRVGAGGGGGG
jgi:hypothetical protein